MELRSLVSHSTKKDTKKHQNGQGTEKQQDSRSLGMRGTVTYAITHARHHHFTRRAQPINDQTSACGRHQIRAIKACAQPKYVRLSHLPEIHHEHIHPACTTTTTATATHTHYNEPHLQDTLRYKQSKEIGSKPERTTTTQAAVIQASRIRSTIRLTPTKLKRNRSSAAAAIGRTWVGLDTKAPSPYTD